MLIADNHQYLFSQVGAKRWLNRSRQPKANAIYLSTYSLTPKKGSDDLIYSMDPRVLGMTERLVQRLNDAFPVDVDPTGFAGPSGVPGNFNSLLNVSGWGMDPLPIPITNNANLIKANKLASDIRAADEPWLKELVKLFFGHVAPSDLYIRKAASTGFPYFTNDNQYKKLSALKLLKECDRFLDQAVSGRQGLESALNDYHTLFLYAIQERQQPNAVTAKPDGSFESKARTAPTEAEARSGDYSGGTVADMTVRDSSNTPIANHFAMRRRDVFGLNGPLNYFLTGILGCFREVYLSRFGFTYKTRDRHDKQQKISNYKFVLGSDVKTMDKMVPEWFLKRVLVELSRYLDDRVVEVIRRAYQAPYVVPPPWRETPASFNPVFGGDPLDSGSFIQHVGLPSGIAINPDWGKLWMTFVYSIVYKDCGALHSPSDLEPWLRGQNREHALLDMSDDAAFLTNSPIIAAELRKAKSPYVILEPETPVIYLGDVFCTVAGKKEVYPNPLTYIVNAVCREDSLEKVTRSQSSVIEYAEGVLARYQTYSSTPIFRELNAIYEEETRRWLGINPYMIARSLARNQKFSEIDAMVKANPHVLHYKVDPKTVSPAVLDEIVAKIPATDFFNDIKHLFKVPTVPLADLKDGEYHE